MHRHHKFPKHLHELGAGKDVLKYVKDLFEIEMLKHADPWRVTLQSAWRYGRHFDYPWAMELKELAQKIQQSMVGEVIHGNVRTDGVPVPRLGEKLTDLVTPAREQYRCQIVAFQYEQLLKVVQKLVSGIEDLCSMVRFRPTPLDQNLIATIIANLNASCEKDFQKQMLHVSQIREAHCEPGDYRPVTRTSRTLFTEFEIADRALMGYFDQWRYSQRDLDSDRAKEYWGAGRHETLDVKMYKCIHCILETYKAQLEMFKHPSKAELVDNLPKWATALSLVYRLTIPRCIHPNGLQRLYDKYVTRNEGYTSVLSQCRAYSTLPPEAVLGVPVEELSPLLTTEEELHTGQLTRTVEPNSLTEKYLVCSELVRHPEYYQDVPVDDAAVPGTAATDDPGTDGTETEESPQAKWMFK